ncbi:MAG: 2-oxo acid dehydrogenase subunit E2 [Promethearchaeota archaeon]
MIYKFIMPKLGWTMTHGKIVKWLKNEGDAVRKGEEILEIETDKVTIKVESPESGTLVKILHESGSSVPVDHSVAVITGEGAEHGEDEISRFIESLLKEEVSPVPSGPSSSPGAKADARGGGGDGMRGSSGRRGGGKVLASPKAKRIARDHGVDLSRVPGTGPGGAITSSDVETYLTMKPAGMDVERIMHDGRLTVTREEEIGGIRRVIADHMYSSLHLSAQLTISTEISMDEASRFRASLNESRRVTGLPKISYTDILAFVVADTLERFPKFNASFDGNVVRYFKEVNLGIAAATGRGLMVPVVWNAGEKSLGEISAKIKNLAKATRTNSITPDELSGSTFTITNLGMFGIDVFTPIINPPELAILGVGRIVTKPVYKNGAVVPSQTMVLSLSFDHQIIDGHEAALYLREVKAMLESGERLESLHAMKLKESLVKSFVAGPSGEDGANLEKDFDVVVIGCGPAGNEAILKLVATGASIAVVERGVLGGTCLNRGCVPLKNLFNLANLRRKVRLRVENGSGLGRNLDVDFGSLVTKKDDVCRNMREGMGRQFGSSGVTVFDGTASFSGMDRITVSLASGEEREISFRKAIIATGATYKPMVDDQGNAIMNAMEIMDVKDIPRAIAFIGDSKTGVELASCFAGLGVEEAFVISERGLHLGNFDEEVKDALVESLELDDVEIIEHAEIRSISNTNGSYTVEFQPEGLGKTRVITVDTVVNASDRVPNTAGLGVTAAGIELNADGSIKTSEQHATTNPDIFAIGDVRNPAGLMVTYLASAQGRACADAIIGMPTKPVENDAVPTGLFTLPPAAAVGLTVTECKKRNIDVDVFYFPYSMLVNAHLVHEINGMIKLIAGKTSKVLLGVQVFGEQAYEIISIASLAIKHGFKYTELMDSLLLHPTFSEIFKEASFSWSLKG